MSITAYIIGVLCAGLFAALVTQGIYQKLLRNQGLRHARQVKLTQQNLIKSMQDQMKSEEFTQWEAGHDEGLAKAIEIVRLTNPMTSLRGHK